MCIFFLGIRRQSMRRISIEVCQLRRRSPRWNVVVRRMTIGTSYTVMRVRRCSPLCTCQTSICFVTFQTQFRTLRRWQGLETENRSRLFSAGLQVPARRTMALLAGLTTVHVVLKRFCICFVARHTQRIVLDVFCIRDFWNGHVQCRELCRLPPGGRLGPIRRRLNIALAS